MKDSIEKFLLFLEAKNSSIHTLRAYRKSLKHVRSFIRYVGERGLKRASTHRMVASVKSFVKWLDVEDLIPLNIGHGVTTPTDPPSQAEIRILLDGELKTPFPERDRALLELLYATGIRNSEACGIMPED